jgi:nucleoside-diphosphate-sugar epimerase
MTNVLITGAGGFIGSHIVREAEQHLDLDLRIAVRRSTPPHATRTAVVKADLTDPASLHGVCDGVDVVVHCASRIGGAYEEAEAVNAHGTRALVDEAQRAGVRHIVQVSTAAVYGRGPFRRAQAAGLPRRPASATSHTRAVGEDAVLAAGGIVLRPHLVHGNRDTRVIPMAARLLSTLSASVDAWRAYASVIAAEDLARVVVAAAKYPERLTESIYHACHPEPVTWNTVMRAIADVAHMTWPESRLTVDEACERLNAAGRSHHDLSMTITDHWFDAEPLWEALDCAPGPGFRRSFAAHADYYRRELNTPSRS